MPRFQRGGGFRRRAFRRRKNWIWSAVELDLTFDNTAVTPVDLLVGTDWERSSSGKELVTLYRIVGWFTVRPPTGAAQQHAWASYIAKYDENEATQLASDVTTYVDEDIMWTDGGTFTDGGTNVEVVEWTTRRIDTKVRRRLSNGQEIRLAFESLGVITGDFQVNGLIRCLVRVGAG